MESAVLQFVLCAIVIVVAGTALTHYADAIADLTGLGRLLVGSLFLAGATSLPELTVDLNAVGLGLADLAVGDLMGSSLFNLLILAVLDLLHRERGRMFSRAAGAHALSATMTIALTALAAFGILVGQQTAHLTVGGVGAGSLAILVAYVLGVRLVFYDQQFAAQQHGSQSQSVLLPAGRTTLPRAVTGYVVAAAVIVVVAPFLAEAADRLAELSGLGHTFIGTTLVALSTSLPELVATYTAVRMGAFDLALGNIFGSNAFNMALLVPLDLAYPGSLLAAVSPVHALTGLATIVVTAVAVVGQLYQIEKRLHFLEPDALLVILLIVGALLMLYALRR
jgi:cation:H+ antiporter